MRVLVVLLAYACAALMAPLLLIVYGFLTEGTSGSGRFGSDDVFIIAAFAVIAAVFAVPVALPVIIGTEANKRGDWFVFAIAGLALGGMMTVLFTPVPFAWNGFLSAAMFIPIAFVCAMTYWAVAWKWLAPATQRSAWQ